MRQKRTSSADNSVFHRLSAGSMDSSGDAGNRSSTGSIPESWSNALDSFNFLADQTQIQKQIQMQRNAKDAPHNVRRALKTPNSSGSSPPCAAATPTSRLSGRGRNVAGSSPNRPGTGGDSRRRSGGAGGGGKPHQQVRGHQTPQNGGRSSSSSSSSSIPTPRRSDGSSPSTSSTDSNRRGSPYTTGAGGKKQVTSKIAGLWKTDVASSGRDSPVSGSRLPVLTKSPPLHTSKPSSLPPSGTRSTKPAASSTTSNLAAAGKSHSVVEGISKSSTYEKISSEVLNTPQHQQPAGKQQGHHHHHPHHHAHNSSSISNNNRRGNYLSPETGTRRGEVFELCDDGDYADGDCYHEEEDYREDMEEEEDVSPHYDTVYDGNSSLDNVFDAAYRDGGSTDCLDSAGELVSHIDSNTFKKKRKNPSISELTLPNADETCRPACSLNDSVGSPHSGDISADSSMDFGRDDYMRKSLSSVNSADLLDNEKVKRKKSKSGEEKAGGGGKTKSKVAQSLKKLFGGKKDKEKDQAKSKSKYPKEKAAGAPMMITKEISQEDKVVLCSQGVNTKSTLRPDHKSSPTAIVAPFNKSPPSAPLAVDTNNAINDSLNNSSDNLEDENSEINLTKTEMLLARRKKLSSNRSDDGDLSPGCIVTTV